VPFLPSSGVGGDAWARLRSRGATERHSCLRGGNSPGLPRWRIARVLDHDLRDVVRYRKRLGRRHRGDGLDGRLDSMTPLACTGDDLPFARSVALVPSMDLDVPAGAMIAACAPRLSSFCRRRYHVISADASRVTVWPFARFRHQIHAGATIVSSLAPSPAAVCRRQNPAWCDRCPRRYPKELSRTAMFPADTLDQQSAARACPCPQGSPSRGRNA
jgi:hypothetical protein